MIVRGIDIEVFAGQPTYYSTEKVSRTILHKGIRINRVFNTQMDKNSTIGKIINSLSFFISILGSQIFNHDKSPFLIVTNPPFLGVVGYICRKLKGRKYIYLIHDVYPEIATVLGYLRKGSLAEKFWHKINHKIFLNAESIIVLGRDMKKVIQKKLPFFLHNKVHFIPNWSLHDVEVPLEKEKNYFASEYGYVDKFVVLYSGNMGLSHDMETIIYAAKELKDKDIYFLFIGGGGKKEKIEKMALNFGLDKIRFLPYQPRENIKYSLNCCDVSIVSLSEGVEGLSVPSKIYGMLAVGKPIIGLLSNESEIAFVINESDCGFVVKPRDINGLVEKILYFYNNQSESKVKGDNARKYFEEHFTLKVIGDKYFSLLTDCF